MKNKTSNNFRLKVKIHRKIQLYEDTQREPFLDDREPLISSFSNQYVSLARKCHVRLLSNLSTSKIYNSSDDHGNDDSQGKKTKTRFKKELSTHTRRYRDKFLGNQAQRKKTKTIRLAQKRHQSISLYSQSAHTSNRNDKHLFFRLNTIVKHESKQKSLHSYGKMSNFDTLIHLQNCNIKLFLKDNSKVSELLKLANHSKKLLTIKRLFQKDIVNCKQIIKQIKQYILKEEGHSISKISQYIQTTQNKKLIKRLIIYQRIVLILIVNLIVQHKFQEYQEECNRAIQIVLGFWYQVISNTYEQYSSIILEKQETEVKIAMQILSEAKLMTKNNLKLLLQTVIIKINIMSQHYTFLQQRINKLIQVSQNLSINRSFYELLTIFSNYIAELQYKNKINVDLVSFFATCPSPYIIKTTNKPYSLVLDLDQTLLHSSFNKNSKNLEKTSFRPGCHDFIQQLSKHYEIIIFTTSVQSYAREVTKNIPHIDHYLFRQHAVRVQNTFLKDLNRIGRHLNRTVIVDDMPSNFQLQKENGIAIKAWKGDVHDKELYNLKDFLIKIAKNNPNDIRQHLTTYKIQVKEKKVSFSNQIIKLETVQQMIKPDEAIPQQNK